MSDEIIGRKCKSGQKIAHFGQNLPNFGGALHRKCSVALPLFEISIKLVAYSAVFQPLTCKIPTTTKISNPKSAHYDDACESGAVAATRHWWKVMASAQSEPPHVVVHTALNKPLVA